MLAWAVFEGLTATGIPYLPTCRNGKCRSGWLTDFGNYEPERVGGHGAFFVELRRPLGEKGMTRSSFGFCLTAPLFLTWFGNPFEAGFQRSKAAQRPSKGSRASEHRERPGRNHVFGCPSNRHHLVLNLLSSFEPIDGPGSGHLPVERHKAQLFSLLSLPQNRLGRRTKSAGGPEECLT